MNLLDLLRYLRGGGEEEECAFLKILLDRFCFYKQIYKRNKSLSVGGTDIWIYVIYYRKCHIMKLFIVSELFFSNGKQSWKRRPQSNKSNKMPVCKYMSLYWRILQIAGPIWFTFTVKLLIPLPFQEKFHIFFNSAGTLFYRQLSYSQKFLTSILKFLFFILLLIIPFRAREWDATIRKVK